MTTLSRTAFLQEMINKSISLVAAQRDTRLSGLNLLKVDTNRNNLLSGETEMLALFNALDQFDANGNAQSIELGTPTNPTRVGRMVTALRELATPISSTPTPNYRPRDAALMSAFPMGLSDEMSRGTRGNTVVALQYTLGRLGFLTSLCDGDFGQKTENAVRSFQTNHQLPVTGKINSATLQALDTAINSVDLRSPAAKATNPMAYLSDFNYLGLSNTQLHSTEESFTWASPAIRAAYGDFIGRYWEVMKQNRVEGDCKNIALFLMDQFRKKLYQDRLIDLPHPVLKNRFAEKQWLVATQDKTQTFFSRADILLQKYGIRVQRDGYQAIQAIQNLDKQHSLLYGVTVHYPEISANQVAKAAVRVVDWNPASDNRNDDSRAEVPIHQLEAGHLIFIDHTGDGSFDHTVTVIRVDKDSNQRTRTLVLAVGSYDDVRDNSASTSVEGVGLAIVNTYTEEITVHFDINGRIIEETSQVTYSSEPPYLVKPRYSAQTTLMELKFGGKVIVGRWA